MTKKTPDANDWREEWVGMPEYEQEDQSPKATVKVHFRDPKDIEEFSKLIGQPINGYRVVWFPAAERRVFSDKRYIDEF
jgi:hypothetical protein